MAEEIEQDLLAKINVAIQEVESTEQYLLAKLVPLRTRFSELKNLLENKATPILAADASRRLRREKLYYLNNVLTEWLILSKKQSPYSPEALLFAINLSRTLKKIRKGLNRGGDASGGASDHRTIISPQPTADASATTTKLEAYRWSTRSVDETKVHGFDHEKMSLERLLVRGESQDGFKAIGIVGMGGIGKTTLCQLIFNNKQVQEHFLPRIWVCMSKQPNEDSDNMKEIVKRILICLGVEEEIIKSVDEKHSLRGLVFALRLQLMGKRYLIVLDDAWIKNESFKNLHDLLTHNDEKCGEKLAYGLPKGHGGTIVVTSRSEELAKEMVGEDNLRRLSPLTDKESCWLIFKMAVAEDGINFPQEDLENLKEEVIKKCAGLPLAAKMMGQIKHQQLVNKRKASESGQNEQQQPQPPPP